MKLALQLVVGFALPVCTMLWFKWKAYKLASDEARFNESYAQSQQRQAMARRYDSLAMMSLGSAVCLLYFLTHLDI